MPGRGMLWSGVDSSPREYILGVHPSGSRCPPIRFRVSIHQVPGVHPSGSGCILDAVSSPGVPLRYEERLMPDRGMLWSGAVSSPREYIPGVHPSGSGCPPVRFRVSIHQVPGVHPSTCHVAPL